MSARLKPLYDLQCIDLEVSRLQKAKASLDDGSASRAEAEAARRDAVEADRLLREASAEMRDKDLTLKSVESKRAAFQEKLYAGKVTNPKELSSMEKEIEMLGRQKGSLEEQLLELMDTIEQRRAADSAAQEAAEAAERRLEEVVAAYKREVSSINARGRELLLQREKAVAAVEPALLKRYDALRAHKGVLAVSRVEDGDCSACHTHIPSGDLGELRGGESVITCENCGRILYLEQ